MLNMSLKDFKQTYQTNKEVYLGDGAYAAHSTNGYVVFTTDGISVRNYIFFEPEMIVNLFQYTQGNFF